MYHSKKAYERRETERLKKNIKGDKFIYEEFRSRYLCGMCNKSIGKDLSKHDHICPGCGHDYTVPNKSVALKREVGRYKIPLSINGYRMFSEKEWEKK